MSIRQKLLIVFPDYHFPYSPTVINLYDLLSQKFDVKILALEPLSFLKKQNTETRNVEYINVSQEMKKLNNKLSYFLIRIITKLFFRTLGKVPPNQIQAAILLWKKIYNLKVNHVIAVDFLGLWLVQWVFGKGHFVSLEIDQNNPFYQSIDPQKISSVIIQTEDRYQYLFPQQKLTRFLVQNAPIYQPLRERPFERKGLIFCGTALPEFGIYYCLNFLAEYPEFILTIRGGIRNAVKSKIQTDYGYLIEEKRLILDETYLERDELAEYLSQFLIGFCFYDLEILSQYYDVFNYITVPSGKLFNYYGAGVPVVGSDLPGLSSVKEFETGVLINDFSPRSIKQAIDAISRDQARLSENCFKAAEYYSFDKALKPFEDFLLEHSITR